MLRRIAYTLLAAALLAAVLGSCSYAQIAGVKGNGMIIPGTGRNAVFDINVSQSGNVIFGGFKYREYQADSSSLARPTHLIYSQSITSLQVSGNYVKVTAVGFWNNQLSDLTVEARDNSNSTIKTPDWFHITAKPRGQILWLYDASGDVVRGDIVVYGSTAAPGYTDGIGAIQVGKNIGSFQFKAQRTATGVAGQAFYLEASTIADSTSVMPYARIYLPAVQRLEINGKTAIFGGVGTYNGRSAIIEIKVVDNYNPKLMAPFVAADEFYITARPVFTTATNPIGYSAGGPLIKGDLEVVTVQ